MRASELFLKTIAKLGVHNIFGIVGGEAQAIQFDEEKAIKFYLTRHEFAAGIMADVYGRLTNQPQVCYSTFGPGLTNLATGVCSSMLDRSPMLAVSAQIHRPEIRFNQTHQCIDNVNFMRPLTKFSAQIESIDSIPALVHQALEISINRIPGPTYLSFPLDVMLEEVDNKTAQNWLLNLSPLHKRPASVPTEEQIERIVKSLQNAKAPIIVAGNQVIRENACGVLKAFVEKLNIPIMSTLASKGVISEDHPLSITAGNKYLDKIYRKPLITDIFRKCDLIILIGYDYGEDLKPSMWEKNIPTMMINSFYNDMGEVFQPSALIVADLKTILEKLHALPFAQKSLPDTIVNVKRILDKRTILSNDVEMRRITEIIHSIRAALGPSGILCSDIGLHKQYAGLLSKSYQPDTFMCSNVCGTFGFGLPAGLAAKLAKPEKRVCVICGDGGFHSTSQELETAVRYKIPIVIVMLKDDAFGLIKYYQLLDRDDVVHDSVSFGSVDFVKLASANGMHAKQLKDVSQLKSMMEHAFQVDEPMLIEIPIQYNYDLLDEVMEPISLSKPVPKFTPEP